MNGPAKENPSGGMPEGQPISGKDLEAALASEEDEALPAGSGVHHWVGVGELRFTQLMVAAMTGLVLASAITRSVGKPVAWTVDLALLAFAWAVFIGADLALRSGRMVNIDLMVSRLPTRVRAMVQLFNTMLIFAFLAAMVGLGLILSYTTRSRSFAGLPWLSYTWATLAVPVGCAFMLWTTVRSLRDEIKQLRTSQAEAIGESIAGSREEGLL